MKKFLTEHKKGLIAIIVCVCVFAVLTPIFVWWIGNPSNDDIEDEAQTSNVTIYYEKECDLIEKSIITSEHTINSLNLSVKANSPLASLENEDVFVIAAGSSNIFGEVYFGKIASKTKNGDDYNIEVVIPAADEVFDSFDIDGNVDMSVENMVSISAVDGVELKQTEELNVVPQSNTNGTILQMSGSKAVEFDVDDDDIIFSLNVDILDLLKKQGVGSETEIHAEKITTADEANNTNVYYTDTGLCYHRETCHCLAKSKYLISLKDAVFERELRACKICEAPILVYDDVAEKISAEASLELKGQVVLKDLSFSVVGREGDDWNAEDGFTDLTIKTEGTIEADATLTGNFEGTISGTPTSMSLFGDKFIPNLYLEGLNEKLLPLVFITWNGGTVSVKVGPACDEVHAPLNIGIMLYTDIYGNIKASTEVYCAYSNKIDYQYDVFRDGKFINSKGSYKFSDVSNFDWRIKAEAEAEMDLRTINVSAMVYIGNLNVLEFGLTKFGIEGSGSIVLKASNVSAINSLATDAKLSVYAQFFDLDFKLKYKFLGVEKEYAADLHPIIKITLAEFEYLYENSSDIVADAINYEKPVDVIDKSLGIPEEYSNHRIIVPELVGTTNNLKVFNEKILSKYITAYNILVNDEEGDLILLCDYEYSVYDNLVAISVMYDQGVQQGGFDSRYDSYYYDFFKDEEITFDEYLKRMGLDKETLTRKIMNHDEYSQIQNLINPDKKINITDAMLDEENVIIYYDEVMTMDGWASATFKMNMFEE